MKNIACPPQVLASPGADPASPSAPPTSAPRPRAVIWAGMRNLADPFVRQEKAQHRLLKRKSEAPQAFGTRALA